MFPRYLHFGKLTTFLARADYWKSQPKKFCEFCKCWIADNKPSVEFHEKGKRHKENVAKKITEIQKKSTSEQKKKRKMDDDLAKMNEAALQSYKQDVESNPDMSAGKFAAAERQAALEQYKVEEEALVNDKAPKKKRWMEAVTDKGQTYYYHSKTGESTWEQPKSYVSLAEQKQQQKKAEAAAKAKKRKAKEAALYFAGPQQKPDAYGRWQRVSKEDDEDGEPVDLELPQQEVVSFRVPSAEEPKVKFQEKTVKSLATVAWGESPIFKKRKCAPNRKNMRQRLNDD